jgi:hypothetical protein
MSTYEDTSEEHPEASIVVSMWRGLLAIETSDHVVEGSHLSAIVLRCTKIGFDSETGVLEFSACVPDNDYITPADVFLLASYLENGTSDGEEFSAIRVAFPTREAAEKDAAPLRDLGVDVVFFSQAGEWDSL